MLYFHLEHKMTFSPLPLRRHDMSHGMLDDDDGGGEDVATVPAEIKIETNTADDGKLQSASA